MEKSRPKSTPWGKAQSCRSIAEGVYSVSTAGHGGLMVHRSLFGKLSAYALAHGIAGSDADYLGFEEDCDWALPVHELKLVGIADPKAVLDTLVFWHCEYANEEEIKKLLSVDQLSKLELRIIERTEEAEANRLRAQKSPELVVAASSLNRASDYQRVFRLPNSVESDVEVLRELAKIGIVSDEDAILKSLDQASNLVAVWTADDKIHIVDGYPERRSPITKLSGCGKCLYSTN